MRPAWRSAPYPDDETAPLAVRRVLVIDGRVVDDDGGARTMSGRAASVWRASSTSTSSRRASTSDWAFADASLLPAIASPDEGRVDAVAEALRARAA